jgi:putative phosphoribosyl transferase
VHHPTIAPVFENRYDAGRKLAEKLTGFSGTPITVLGIPNGGVAVALGVALALQAELDLVISRKIPLPLSPEGCFGSVSDDGTTILDDAVIKNAGLSESQINYQVSKVRADIRHRSLLYHTDRPPVTITGRTVIIVDDGLASGYTMQAAVASLRNRKPEKIIAAVPVGPEHAIAAVAKVADRVITCAVGTGPEFYVSDYYRSWHDITDAEVLSCLKEWRLRRHGLNIEIPQKKRETL